MVSKKTLKSYEFESMNEYFEYIIESNTNGQIQQAKSLYKNLSFKQKEDFLIWFETFFHYDALDNDEPIMKTYINLINKLTN